MMKKYNQDLLIRNLRPYFSALPLQHLKDFKARALGQNEVSRWVKIHPSYLSATESFQLGLILFEEGHHQLDFQTKLNYFVHAYEQGNAQIKLWALIAQGVVYFELALCSPKDEQKRNLRIAASFFYQAQESAVIHLIPRLYLALILVAQDKLGDALKKLYQIAKLAALSEDIDVTLPTYEILSKIYLTLGQERISRFYLTKMRHKRIPISVNKLANTVIAA